MNWWTNTQTNQWINTRMAVIFNKSLSWWLIASLKHKKTLSTPKATEWISESIHGQSSKLIWMKPFSGLNYLFWMNCWVNDSMPHWNHTKTLYYHLKLNEMNQYINLTNFLNALVVTFFGCVKIWQNFNFKHGWISMLTACKLQVYMTKPFWKSKFSISRTHNHKYSDGYLWPPRCISHCFLSDLQFKWLVCI